MASPLLRATDLHKSYGGRVAVDGISFELEAGRTLGLIGPNGAGKSTTVSMLCSLLHPDRGEVTIAGQKLEAGASEVKRMIGLVPQDLALIDDISARENLKLFGALYGLKGAALKQRCDEALALVNLEDRAGDKPATFSGGMKRRLNIAAALLHDPQLLILDEPTVGIDPQSRNAIFETLEAQKRLGRSLIYTSHYMEEVERLADHIVIIDHGKLLANESPEALHKRLPAQAALSVTLAEPADPAILDALRDLDGVTGVEPSNDNLQEMNILLLDGAQAAGVLQWLVAQGCRPDHFATARTRLEDIFLTLTGRSLRD
jgi:ABC-2 type transport system ATP-binding protein